VVAAILTISGVSLPAIVKTAKTLKKKKEERLEIVKTEIKILEEKIDSLTNVFIIYINANGSSEKLKKQLNTILQNSKNLRNKRNKK
jgi:allophanate hydrolase subunit 1